MASTRGFAHDGSGGHGVRTRTAVGAVGGAVLLLAAAWAFMAWAVGGTPGLLAFVVPLAVLGAVTVLIGSALMARLE